MKGRAQFLAQPEVSVIRLLSLAFFAAVALASPALAQVATDAPAGTYKLDLTHASVHWKVNHLGLSNYTGRFARMDATLTFDPAAPEKSKLVATVDPLSVRTDYPAPEKHDFDKTLSTDAKWFNAGVAKAITFTSTSIVMTGPKTADVTGDLSLLGVSKPITLKATFNGGMKEHPFAKKPALGFSATGRIKRSDFGMTYLVPNIGDEVEIIIETEFHAS